VNIVQSRVQYTKSILHLNSSPGRGSWNRKQVQPIRFFKHRFWASFPYVWCKDWKIFRKRCIETQICHPQVPVLDDPPARCYRYNIRLFVSHFPSLRLLARNTMNITSSPSHSKTTSHYYQLLNISLYLSPFLVPAPHAITSRRLNAWHVVPLL